MQAPKEISELHGATGLRWLWGAVALVALLGSIYPFNFAFNSGPGAYAKLWGSCCTMPGRGDLMGNVILFVPFGFLGFLATSGSDLRGRVGLVVVVGSIFAFALQLLQVHLPSRDENLQDVLWNGVGILAGGGFAVLVREYVRPMQSGAASLSLLPACLLMAWLAYRLMPFVPSLDWQLIKNSVKPLFNPGFSFGGIVHDAVAWTAVGYLLKELRAGAGLDRYLPALIAAVLALEVVIVSNAVTAPNVLGALFALLLWPALRNSENSASVLGVVLLGGIVVSGLSPFITAAQSAPFNWLPFHGYLGGSMYLNAQSALDKVFLYGAVIFMLSRSSLTTRSATTIAFVTVLVIELAQTRFVGHTPEITDPLLVLLAAWTLTALARYEQHLPAARDGLAGQGRNRPLRWLSRMNISPGSSDWIQCDVNLRLDQVAFLSRLSRELGVSVSGASRRVLKHVIEHCRAQSVPLADAIRECSNGIGSDTGWDVIAVNLHKSQFSVVQVAAQELDSSPSRVVRMAIQTFMNDVDRSDAKPLGETS